MASSTKPVIDIAALSAEFAPPTNLSPPQSVALGNDVYLVVNCYEGKQYVHIRLYKTRGFRNLPTAVGVAFTTEMWLNFMTDFERMSESLVSSDTGNVLFQEGGIMVFVAGNAKRGVQFVKGLTKGIFLTEDMFMKLIEADVEIRQWFEMLI